MKPGRYDSRRLTGGNLFWDRPGAILDVSIEGPPEPVISHWKRAVTRLLTAVGRSDEATRQRVFEGGASLLISAPIDALYSMCELNEVAWEWAVREIGGEAQPDLELVSTRLRAVFDQEANPALLAVQAAARERGVPFLWDDDEVSVGYGKSALIWAPDCLPSPAEIDWESVESIPLALVTGTNGKSTTVRMTASIMSAAGFAAGVTSTDFIRVADRVVVSGDYSGTGGARVLLRQPDIEVAVLEVARGGLLRRGLGVERANAAVVTNVAADHLGEYGINTVQELIPAKFIVRRALGEGDPLILNADDEGVVAFAESLDHALVWFSLDPDKDLLRRHLAGGGLACYLSDGCLVAAQAVGGDICERARVDSRDIPATRGGIARYNVSNALAAMAIAVVLGIPDEAIRRGLCGFRCDEHDNPGRGNWFEHGNVRILVDFAHNEHGMTALADLVLQVEAERVVLLMGQAGDRSDADIADLSRAACSMHPNELLICELPGYERGREPFTVPELIRKSAIDSGQPVDSIKMFSSPEDATRMALSRAREGDLLVLLVLTQRHEALALVHEYLGDNG